MVHRPGGEHPGRAREDVAPPGRASRRTPTPGAVPAVPRCRADLRQCLADRRARLDRGVRGGRAPKREPPSDHRTQPPGRALGRRALGARHGARRASHATGAARSAALAHGVRRCRTRPARQHEAADPPAPLEQLERPGGRPPPTPSSTRLSPAAVGQPRACPMSARAMALPGKLMVCGSGSSPNHKLRLARKWTISRSGAPDLLGLRRPRPARRGRHTTLTREPTTGLLVPATREATCPPWKRSDPGAPQFVEKEHS
jgi:hypothetical protein